MRRGLSIALMVLLMPIVPGCNNKKDPEPAPETLPDIPPGRTDTPAGEGGPVEKPGS